MNKKDQHFMRRAIQLALLGNGTVSPNPMVGCVIVWNDTIIGEGWHQKAGEAHAEVNAVKAVRQKELLSEATVYVTLEPCAHYGKTPPCADLLVNHLVQRVVIGCVDPNPLVGGKGIDILQNAGIEVTVDCLKEDCVALNKVFFHSINTKSPYVVLKWAQTADGFVARNNFDSKWISGAKSRQLVHKWRATYDAILVGKNTALYDDPSLNVRDWSGKNPLRVVIDHQCVLPDHLKIYDKSEQTIIYNLNRAHQTDNLIWVKLNKEAFIEELLADLHQRKITSLFVEGGSDTLKQFINAGFWNEANIFISDTEFKEGIKAPQLNNSALVEVSTNTGDKLFTYKKTL